MDKQNFDLYIDGKKLETIQEKIESLHKKQEGLKYDNGKPRIFEMVEDFKEPLIEVSKVWAFGADKYEKHNWAYVDNAIDRYSNALLRHMLEGETTDDESGLLHASHVAWNALARLYFIIQKQKEKGVENGHSQN